jgi:membrane associated rhomboid family serine protease
VLTPTCFHWKEKPMLNLSRPLVISLAFAALAGLVLGLATDIGLFGWSAALLLALYLGAAGGARLARRSRSARTRA